MEERKGIEWDGLMQSVRLRGEMYPGDVDPRFRFRVLPFLFISSRRASRLTLFVCLFLPFIPPCLVLSSRSLIANIVVIPVYRVTPCVPTRTPLYFRVCSFSSVRHAYEFSLGFLIDDHGSLSIASPIGSHRTPPRKACQRVGAATLDVS